MQSHTTYDIKNKTTSFDFIFKQSLRLITSRAMNIKLNSNLDNEMSLLHKRPSQNISQNTVGSGYLIKIT